MAACTESIGMFTNVNVAESTEERYAEKRGAYDAVNAGPYPT